MNKVRKNSIFQVLISNESFSDSYGDSFIIEVKIPKEMLFIEAQNYCKEKVMEFINNGSKISTITIKE